MKHWYTADTHFGHDNIIKHCARPFESASHMDAVLLENLASKVGPQDALWIVGDFAFGPNSRGKSWTYSGFSSSWHTFKTHMRDEGHSIMHLTPKGLRHTLATSLREEGMDERAIADVLGQKTPAMARHYSRNAGLAKKNKKTLKSIRKREKALAKVVKPSQKSVKPSNQKASKS